MELGSTQARKEGGDDERDATASVTVTVLSHHGAVRTNNEDCALVAGLTLAGSERALPVTASVTSADPIVVAVADGLGGHSGGELASATAIRRLARDGASLSSIEAITEVVRLASADVVRTAAATPSAPDMGTTVVGLAITSSEVFCFNVGDSPAYALEEGYLRPVTVIDNPMAAAEALGLGPARSNIVTQVLGPASAPIAPHVRGYPARAGDTYLLCSDGLTDLVPLTEIERLLLENSDDDARAARALWAAAMNLGGHDNITLTIVRLC